MAAGSVGSGQIAAGAVGSNQIASGAVTSANIAAGAVGAAQANDNQVQLHITGTCDPRTTLAGVNPDGSVACAVLPLGVAYLAHSDRSNGRFTAIAIRDEGLPIISYRDLTNNNLKVFSCGDPRSAQLSAPTSTNPCG